MKSISGQIIGFKGESSSQLHSTTALDVAASGGHKVARYEDLITAVAEIAFRNPRHNLFFRGQSVDHREYHTQTKRKISSIRPTIYRGELGRKNPTKKESKERIEALDKETKNLQKRWHGPGSKKINRHDELAWALLQHYGGCRTPLLDITQSLRVAASFACPEGRKNYPPKTAYVYIFGLPAIGGGLTYCPDDDIVLIRLQSTCPPKARRPHYQQGYLVGDFPYRRDAATYWNLGRRMLAKIEIDTKEFWSPLHRPVPWLALMPGDETENELVRLIESSPGLVAKERGDD